MKIEIYEHEINAIRWALKKGMENTGNDQYYDSLCDIDSRIESEL